MEGKPQEQKQQNGKVFKENCIQNVKKKEKKTTQNKQCVKYLKRNS